MVSEKTLYPRVPFRGRYDQMKALPSQAIFGKQGKGAVQSGETVHNKLRDPSKQQEFFS